MESDGDVVVQDPHSHFDKKTNKWLNEAGKYTISFGQFHESFRACRDEPNSFVLVANGSADQFHGILSKYKDELVVHCLRECTGRA